MKPLNCTVRAEPAGAPVERRVSERRQAPGVVANYEGFAKQRAAARDRSPGAARAGQGSYRQRQGPWERPVGVRCRADTKSRSEEGQQRATMHDLGDATVRAAHVESAMAAISREPGHRDDPGLPPLRKPSPTSSRAEDHTIVPDARCEKPSATQQSGSRPEHATASSRGAGRQMQAAGGRRGAFGRRARCNPTRPTTVVGGMVLQFGRYDEASV